MAADTGRRSELPLVCRALLAIAARLVPPRFRRDWVAEWSAELAYGARRQRSSPRLVRCSLGSLHDAFWIRTHEWSPEMLLQDLRFAVRTYLQRPGFALVAIGTLALGIGANTVLFSIVNGVLLSPLPYPESDRLVRLYGTNPQVASTYSNMNPMDLIDVRDGSTLIEGLAYVTTTSRTLTGVEQPQRLSVSLVAADFFRVVGVEPAHGRSFHPSEERPGDNRVVVLSDATWKNVFGGDEGILGQSLQLNGEPHVVIGVMPPGFVSPLDGPGLGMWQPWPLDLENPNRRGHFMRAVARLRPGVSVATAQEEIDTLYAAIAETYNKGDRGIAAVALQEALVGPVRPLLLTLLGALGFVLLIVCANIANLLLARSAQRRQEIAVRAALGAGRARITRQLVTETIVLALAGGLAGTLLAAQVIRAARGGLGGIPNASAVTLDLRVLAFSAVVSALTGLLFGLAPAWQMARSELVTSLRGQSVLPGSRQRLRAAMIVAEVALSIVLLIGAGLMIRSFGRLTAVDPGFDPDGLLSFRVEVPESEYPDPAQSLDFFEQAQERIARLPGFVSVGATNRLPFSGSYSCDLFVMEGWPNPEPGHGQCAEERVVSGDYFTTMGISLVEGRWLAASDSADAEPVVLVSETMVERFIEDQAALGAGFKWGLHDERPFRRVVGVVRDVKHRGLDRESMTEVYMPHAQYPSYRRMFVVVRHRGEIEALLAGVRDEIRTIDPNVPLFQIAPLRALVDASVSGERLVAQALGLFSAFALMLASLGLYGLLAYMVSQRSAEIGVRMALGAHAGNVVSLVVGQGMRLVAGGIALGLLGGWLLSSLLQGLLFEVDATDPTTFLVVAGLLGVVALVASWLPARRATRVDPTVALRS